MQRQLFAWSSQSATGFLIVLLPLTYAYRPTEAGRMVLLSNRALQTVHNRSLEVSLLLEVHFVSLHVLV